MRRLCVAIAALCAALAASPLQAQPSDSSRALTGDMVVAIAPMAPFAILHDDGSWDGIAVELWRQIMDQEGTSFVFREVAASELLDAVTKGRADVAFPVVASPEAEQQADLVHTFYSAPLGLAESSGGPPSLGTVAGRVFSPTFFKVVAGLALVLLFVGLLVWLFERRGEDSQEEDEDAQFREGKVGLWDGFWWAGVTMTTIGYGDKAPETVGGKITALLWMLVSMGLTAALTATIVSALGLGSGSGKSGTASLPDALKNKRIGAVADVSASAYLDLERVSFRSFPSVAAGLEAVASDSLDVFVAGMPLLEHAQREGSGSDLSLRPTRAATQQWSFAVAPESRLREPLGRAVVAHTRGPNWQATLERYLGSGS